MSMTVIVSGITRTTKDSYNEMGLEKSFGQIIVVKGSNYNDQQMRELPALLFEFYIEDGNDKYYLENMNKVWSLTSNEPLQLVRIPTDAKIRVVPLYDEDYINTLANPSSSIDLSVYVDVNISY